MPYKKELGEITNFMFAFIENLKINEIIYRYRDFKKEHSDFNEDQLCRLTISKRLKDYPQQYNLQDNNEERIRLYMEDLFKEKLNLKYVCQWLMEQEYSKYNLLHNSQDLSGWRTRSRNLEIRIERLLNKIPGI